MPGGVTSTARKSLSPLLGSDVVTTNGADPLLDAGEVQPRALVGMDLRAATVTAAGTEDGEDVAGARADEEIERRTRVLYVYIKGGICKILDNTL